MTYEPHPDSLVDPRWIAARAAAVADHPTLPPWQEALVHIAAEVEAWTIDAAHRGDPRPFYVAAIAEAESMLARTEAEAA